LYLLPKAVAHLRKYMKEFHGTDPNPESYVFYSRNTGSTGKLTQPAIAKMLRKYALTAHEICPDVPLTLHAHQFRHAKASHWLEDGMNIVQISFLLGHEQLQTTMVYLDITIEQEAKALATLESENDKKIQPKWKNTTGTLTDFCGVRAMKK
jgi:site-specific recombinase XerD